VAHASIKQERNGNLSVTGAVKAEETLSCVNVKQEADSHENSEVADAPVNNIKAESDGNTSSGFKIEDNKKQEDQACVSSASRAKDDASNNVQDTRASDKRVAVQRAAEVIVIDDGKDDKQDDESKIGKDKGEDAAKKTAASNMRGAKRGPAASSDNQHDKGRYPLSDDLEPIDKEKEPQPEPVLTQEEIDKLYAQTRHGSNPAILPCHLQDFFTLQCQINHNRKQNNILL
jgi:hypothetical protein